MLIHFTQADIEAAISAVIRSRLDPNQDVDLVFTFTSGRNTKKRQGNGTSASIITVSRSEAKLAYNNDQPESPPDLFSQDDADDSTELLDWNKARLHGVAVPHYSNVTSYVSGENQPTYVMVKETPEEYEAKLEEAVEVTKTRSLFPNHSKTNAA